MYVYIFLWLNKYPGNTRISLSLKHVRWSATTITASVSLVLFFLLKLRIATRSVARTYHDRILQFVIAWMGMQCYLLSHHCLCCFVPEAYPSEREKDTREETT